MSDYIPEEDLGVLDDEMAGFDVPDVPLAQPVVTAEYGPTMSGEDMAAAAAAFANTPQAQQYYAQAQAAYEQSERDAAAPAIHAIVDSLDDRNGAVADRRAVIAGAEEVLEDLVAEYGASEATAQKALEIGWRKAMGKATYDDVVMVHAARARRRANG